MVALPDLDRTVAAIFETYERARAAQPPRGYLGGSEIGEDCKRKLWYRFRQARRPNFPGRILRLFDTGTREERRVISDLRSIGVEVLSLDPNTGNQWEIVECDGHLKGHADGVLLGLIEAPKTWHLFEGKTASEKYYKAIVKHGVKKAKPVYWAQCQLYMGGLGLKRCAFIVVNKNTDEIYLERIKFDPKAYKALIEKARSIIYVDSPPTRISSKPDFWQCRFCDMAELCHGVSWPDVNCRTCAHSTPIKGGAWSCARELPMSDDCAEHVVNPSIVDHWAEPIDGSPEWIKYRVRDSGYEFVNCAASSFPAEAVDHFSSRDLRNG